MSSKIGFRKNLTSLYNYFRTYIPARRGKKKNNQIANEFANIATIPGDIGNQTSSARNQVIQLDNISIRSSHSGTHKTSTGSQRTSTGTHKTSTGSQRTSTGTSRTSTGTSRTSTGTSRTSTGTSRTSTGSQRTSTGTQRTPTESQRSPVLSRQRIIANKEKENKRLRDAHPDYLTDMPDEMIDIVLKQRLGHLSPFVLNKEFLLQLTSQEVALLKPLIKNRESPRIERYLLPNIQIIDLVDITLNNYIIEVLNMTVDHSSVKTIILRNISFETDDDIYNFIQYLKKNTQIERLILRNILITKLYFNDFLDIIGELNNITLFEFSEFDIIKNFVVKTSLSNNNDIYRYFEYSFIKILIKLEKLQYLIFNNNNIHTVDYEGIFINNYVIDEKYMNLDEHLVKGTNKMLYNVKSGQFDINDTFVKDNYYMHIISSHYKKTASACILRRCLTYYTYGNEDKIEKIKCSNYESKIVKKSMKDLRKIILEKFKTNITNLALTNNSSGSRSSRSSGSSGSSISIQEAIIANIIANHSPAATMNRNSSS